MCIWSSNWRSLSGPCFRLALMTRWARTAWASTTSRCPAGGCAARRWAGAEPLLDQGPGCEEAGFMGRWVRRCRREFLLRWKGCSSCPAVRVANTLWCIKAAAATSGHERFVCAPADGNQTVSQLSVSFLLEPTLPSQTSSLRNEMDSALS